VKKFREGAKVVVFFWISRFMEGENASEERHSFVVRDESQCEKRQLIVSSSIVHVQCCRWFFRLAGRRHGQWICMESEKLEKQNQGERLCEKLINWIMGLAFE